LRLINPASQKLPAVVGKKSFVVCANIIKCQRGQRHNAGISRIIPAAGSLVADIAIGQCKSRFPVVVLLGDDAIKTDATAAQRLHPGIPYLDAVALAAILRLDDVKPDKTE